MATGEIAKLVHVLFEMEPDHDPSHCRNCWDMPGYDVNCGGGVEPCRYCTDGFTGQVPTKLTPYVAPHWLAGLFTR